MKNAMMLYGVTLGKRYSKRQKAWFFSHIGKAYPALGFPLTLDESKSRAFGVSNAVAGDWEKAGVIFAASYDTPTRSFLPNLCYYPFHTEKNIAEERKDLALQAVLTLMLAAVAYFSARLFLSGQGVEKILFLLLAMGVALCTIYFATPRANRFNFNRNSASLAVMEKIAENCKGNPNVAFAFLDKNVNSFEGLKEFQNSRALGEKHVVLLDCLSYGPTLLLAHRAGENAQAEKLIELAKNAGVQVTDRVYSDQAAEQNVLSFAKHMLVLVSGTVKGKEFVVEHTKSPQDIQVDTERLSGIAQTLAAYAGPAAE